MKLIECYIENFGKIKNKHISFSDGLNCIKDDNGSGKTTLSVFIKVMLYGMSDTKKASLEENDRRHYLPWDGSTAIGSLTFATGDKQYRIERSFAQKASDDTFSLYDCHTGKASDDYSEKVGEELFGIDADGFERTVFLSERALTPKSENKSVSAKLSDLVGCDGDIGVMDNAMKLLEEQRKFYYKKGGSGELSNTKLKIVEATKKLERLADLETDAENIEKRTLELQEESKKLTEERSRLTKEREESALASARADLKRRYEELKQELSKLSETERSLLDFFGGTPPTFAEVTENSLKLTEAESIEKKISADCESDEFKELKNYFFQKIDDGEKEKIRAAIYEEKSRRESISSDEAVRLSKKFSKRIPTQREVDELITLAVNTSSQRKKGAKFSFLIAGSALAVLGICLGLFASFAFLLISVLGIASIIFAFVGIKSNIEPKDKYNEFYISVSDSDAPEESLILSDLYEIKLDIEKAEALRETEKRIAASNTLTEFCNKFSTDFPDNIAFAEEILKKHERYVTLISRDQYRIEETERLKKRAEELRSSAREFIEKYPTQSDAPFNEIHEKLNEYERITLSISDKKRELQKFGEQYVTEKANESVSRSCDEISAELMAVEEKLSEIEREKAVSNRAYQELCAELESKDEVTIRLSELEELYEKQAQNYGVVIKTKEYLERAKDEMTAKYLGKTKSGFIKYSSLIGGESDDRFEMTTDFGVTKLEGASTKPTDAYSRGTKDLYNLASRLGLIDSLYENEEPFLILDDPFIAFDDEKIGSALALLKKLGKERQIIYFTCSSSRSV